MDILDLISYLMSKSDEINKKSFDEKQKVIENQVPLFSRKSGGKE